MFLPFEISITVRQAVAFLFFALLATGSFAETINLHCKTESIKPFGEKEYSTNRPIFVARIEMAESIVYWGIGEPYPHEINKIQQYQMQFNRECLPQFKGKMCWKSGGVINRATGSFSYLQSGDENSFHFVTYSGNCEKSDGKLKF